MAMKKDKKAHSLIAHHAERWTYNQKDGSKVQLLVHKDKEAKEIKYELGAWDKMGMPLWHKEIGTLAEAKKEFAKWKT